jgi:hypothetical protein
MNPKNCSQNCRGGLSNKRKLKTKIESGFYNQEPNNTGI